MTADGSGTRRTVDQDACGALVPASCRSEDVGGGEPVSTSTIASCAAPTTPTGTPGTPGGSRSPRPRTAPAPATAPALAARLRATAAFADRAERLDGPDEAAPLLGPAVEFAEACLRHDPWPLSVPGCARVWLARLCLYGVSPAPTHRSLGTAEHSGGKMSGSESSGRLAAETHRLRYGARRRTTCVVCQRGRPRPT